MPQSGDYPAGEWGAENCDYPVTNAVTESEPLCLYPLTARYRGYGSTAAPSS